MSAKKKALDLMTALRNMTLMARAAIGKTRARLSRTKDDSCGSRCGHTVFNPDTIIDKATFDDPLRYSDGISYVLVNGVPGDQDWKLVEGIFPGRAARSPIAQ